MVKNNKNHEKEHRVNNRKNSERFLHKSYNDEDQLSGNFFNLFIEEINEIYNAEHQILKELPKIAKEASSEELREALEHHVKETRNQVKRLEKIFHLLGVEDSGGTSWGMDGLLKEGKEAVQLNSKSSCKDAVIIGSCQKVEHYEIACYGTARAHAKHLNLTQIANLLDESLDEESAADKKLTKLAEGSFFTTGINKLALEEAYAHA